MARPQGKQDLEFEVKFGVTPRGKAKWCKRDTPDDYGKFSVNLYLSDEDTEAFKTMLEDMRKAGADLVDDNGKKISGLADVYKEDADGNVFFTFKVDASKVETGKITIVDKFGKGDNDFNKKIGNDSVIKVKYMAKPYYMASTKQVGVSLRLMAIQVIELKEYSGGGSDFSDESTSDEF